MKGRWEPLLADEERDRALQAVELIARDLARTCGESASARAFFPTPISGPASLGAGSGGLALFFAHLHQAFPDREHDGRAIELLERTLDDINRAPIPPGLFSGLPGVAWLLEHLGGIFQTENDDPGEAAAEALADHVSRSPWKDDCSLHHGLIGLGVYALERLPRPHGRRCLEETVARLGEAAEHGPEEGAFWRSLPEHLLDQEREKFPEGQVNLGVALGQPGVIGFLGEALGAGADVRALLRDAVTWLLRQRLPAGKAAAFPYTVAPGSTPSGTQLAWCYGDLGIAVTLLGAARHAGEPAWEREALDVARSAAKLSVPTVRARDAGLCHGAAGVAHLFNRVYQATGDLDCGKAARTWTLRTLEMALPGQGVGGYRSWERRGGQEEMGWRNDPGFLTGAAGTGLALLAAATPNEPTWDRLLLASIPASAG